MTWSRAAGQQHFGKKRHHARGLRALLVSALMAFALISTQASAQVGEESAKSGAKATVGLALLGAEAVVATEAAFGLNKWWMYAVGGGVGLIGGGVGGFFIDKADNPQLSMSLLVGGMVFAVPATIAMLSATSYKPPKNPEVDTASLAEQREEQMHLARYRPVPSLVDVNQGGKVSLKMPAVEIAPVFSRRSQQMYSLPDATSVKVPVLHLSF